MGDFYVAPGKAIEQGDIYVEIHFSAIRHPFEFFRLRPQKVGKQPAQPTADVFTLEQSQLKSGDSPRSPWKKTAMAMFISHGCEVEGTERDDAIEKRHWLAAPIGKLSQYGYDMQTRIRERTQPNKFFLPPDGEFGFPEEQCADLRYITPIQCKYFTEGEKRCSLSMAAVNDLRSQLGVFFTGLQIWWEPINCAVCGSVVDPADYLVEARNEGD
jgi:hypothetical protein